MNKKEIYNKVAGVVCGRLMEPSTTLADLGADSLDVVELACDLENTFDIEIPDEFVLKKNFSGMTVKALTEYVAKKMEG